MSFNTYYHDKTSYNIMPTPPSPTYSSPSLTQSISLTSQASPPHPVTPPRGRPSSRYPESLGRVPLHRRGTSKTYERLEDLLREAGYKETRIFTPETDRVEARDSSDIGPDAEAKADDRLGAVRGGVGAVVGFLAGLMPGGMPRNPSLHRISPDSAQDYSPPTSPLVHKQTARPQLPRLDSSRSNLTSSSGSLGSALTPTTPRRTNPNIRLTGPVTPPPSSPRLSRHQLLHQPSPAHSNSSLAPTAKPSKAGAYLRHMASAPNMPKRPSSSADNSHRSPRHETGTAAPRRLLVLNDSDADEEGKVEERQPPLPRTWLEAVARAVAFGGPGAYAGGPTLHQNATVARPPALRQTRSSLSQTTLQPARPRGHQRPKAPKSKSKGALSDHTNKPNGPPPALSLAPPRMRAQRSGTSEGKVSQTRVVCRSAPVSRSGSAVRGAGRGDAGVLTGEAIVDLGLGMDADGKRDARAERGRAQVRDAKKRDGVPSLARTRAEGDVWGPNRYLDGWGAGGEGENEDEAGSSSEEEGELDLARILVPPKRQNSIRSLRRHLHVQGAGSGRENVRKARPGMGSRSGTGSRIWRDEGDEGEDEDWGQGWRRKRSRRESDEDEEEGHRITGLLTGGKQRQGIPWAA